MQIKQLEHLNCKIRWYNFLHYNNKSHNNNSSTILPSFIACQSWSFHHHCEADTGFEFPSPEFLTELEENGRYDRMVGGREW